MTERKRELVGGVDITDYGEWTKKLVRAHGDTRKVTGMWRIALAAIGALLILASIVMSDREYVVSRIHYALIVIYVDEYASMSANDFQPTKEQTALVDWLLTKKYIPPEAGDEPIYHALNMAKRNAMNSGAVSDEDLDVIAWYLSFKRYKKQVGFPVEGLVDQSSNKQIIRMIKKFGDQ